ncbi:MAG: 50S ribosomal protein L25 [Syntrophus sp. PtaB.Bin001]|nr:MAG: 50S ribosomal protein L25 [Syntrophus sp. PtaB.Bin001]
MEARELKATIRKETGKGPAKRLRRKGLIPAVLYGPGTELLSLSVNASDLKTARKGTEDNILIKLIIDDSGKLTEKNSFIKEIQIEPLTNNYFHADFYAVSMDHKLTFDVPVHFVGQPVGIEKGGELQHLRREIKVSCFPSALPEFIPVDVTGLDVGDSILIRDLCLPESIHSVDAEDIALATVSSLRVVKKEGTAEEGEPSE